MRAGRIHATLALAGDKDRAIERLDILLDIPGVAWSELLATMQTGVTIARDDEPARIGKPAGWAVPWLLFHGVPPVMYSYEP